MHQPHASTLDVHYLLVSEGKTCLAISRLGYPPPHPPPPPPPPTTSSHRHGLLHICIIQIYSSFLLLFLYYDVINLGPSVFVLPKILNYLAFQSFDLECIWWRLFQKRAVCTRLDIYIFQGGQRMSYIRVFFYRKFYNGGNFSTIWQNKTNFYAILTTNLYDKSQTKVPYGLVW